jgi:hypothetical protein
LESAEGPTELNIRLVLIASLLVGCSRQADEHAAGAPGMTTSSSSRPPQRPADCKARQAAKEPKTVAQYTFFPGLELEAEKVDGKDVVGAVVVVEN